MPIDREKFIELLTQRFPSIASTIDDISRGLLHCEMAHFARATVEAIRGGKIQDVGSHFGLVDQVFADADAAVRNAIYVSYLENIFIGTAGDSTRGARHLLPPALKTALSDLESHWDKIAGITPANDI